MTIAADFGAVNRDRDENSTKRFPATVSVAGAAQPIPITLRTRGHFRRRSTSCSFVPLRVEFPKDRGAEPTVFDGQRALKLVTHCRDNGEYEQQVLREYLVYKVFNVLTPRSFRARLARATYVDSASGKTLTTRYAMFLEDDDDVARRGDSRVIELPRALFADLEQETLKRMMVFEYMVGGTDFSIFKLHNVRLMQDQARALHPVPYDFDMTGLVDAVYALTDKRLDLASVRQRLYRGPCHTEAELQPVVNAFLERRDATLAVYDSLPDLAASYRKAAKQYLQDFYTLVERKGGIRKAFIEGCSAAPTM
jgi:hypothetical protein